MKQGEQIEDRIRLLTSNGRFSFEEGLIHEMAQVGTHRTLPDDYVFMEPGNPVTQIPLVLKGALKISREGKDGEELLLYFLEGGDTCAMSLTCCMNHKLSEVRVTTEGPTEVMLIPATVMDSWIVKYPSWRSFVFESYNLRLDELLESVDTVSFLNMDQRLLKYLKDKAYVTGSMDITSTHQEIAQDLNSSRVVISRLLKRLERDGLIQLSRNKITILKLT
ncbi:Crp/Fnr family transcriptional regulator [Pontibacter sp. G13]|uniref:Crp/Fnr family transcriptional regulator n=1 Tax=Pontibacter sp. G13 TaxID=3074898 RepID=UPI00288BB964|nr:Crp/Fnr family transcriptional regulator [Pontibacter sp. G13]WNJ20161.1 Crp/Fnr family transcriptional regulator [Pontibacter sp. G13]